MILPFWLCDSSMFSSIIAGYSPFVSGLYQAVWSRLLALNTVCVWEALCVYVCVSVCVCVSVFSSLQMMEAQGSPCFNAALSPFSPLFRWMRSKIEAINI